MANEMISVQMTKRQLGELKELVRNAASVFLPQHGQTVCPACGYSAPVGPPFSSEWICDGCGATRADRFRLAERKMSPDERKEFRKFRDADTGLEEVVREDSTDQDDDEED